MECFSQWGAVSAHRAGDNSVAVEDDELISKELPLGSKPTVDQRSKVEEVIYPCKATTLCVDASEPVPYERY